MKWLFLALVLFGFLFLYGCTIPTPCVPSELGIAGNLSPSNYEIVSITPSLTWEYPSTSPSPYPYPTGSSDCAISGYQVFLAEFNNQYYDLGGDVSGASNTTFSPAALEPATYYFWEVRAISASGPGPWTGKHAFVTGPICDLSDLAAPYTFAPVGTVDTLRPDFIWWGDYSYDSGCVPSGYHLELSTDPSFSSTVATVDTNIDPIYTWQGWTPDSDLEDCTEYYWRVASRNESAIGVFANQSFDTQVGLCLIPHVFIPWTNSNCRIGPNPLYARQTILNPEDRLPVLARHQTADDMWYKVQLDGNISCWVSEVTGELEGDPAEILVSDDFPPLPVDRPEGDDDEPASCSGLSQAQCDATPGCSYNLRTKSCVSQ